MLKITSPDNPKIKEIARLRKARRAKKENIIIIEGTKELELARAAGLEFSGFYYCPAFGHEHDLPDTNIFELSPAVFKKISLRQNPDGLLALARRPEIKLKDLKLPSKPLLVVLEGVEKGGNLGAILRTCDSAGVDAVLVCDSRVDIYNHNAIRNSRGAVFTNQLVGCGTEEALEYLQNNDINVVAAYPDSEKAYTDIDYTKATAIVVGAEHEGLSDTWREAGDRVFVPMKGKIDSLNVSVSAGVMIYEALRQRKN